jgi:hypothetical protein
MLHRVVWYEFTDVSEVRAASIIRAMRASVIALMMEAASTYETSVNYQITRPNIPKTVILIVEAVPKHILGAWR